jgi:hypothetical protein
MGYQNRSRRLELVLAAALAAMPALPSWADNAVAISDSPAILSLGPAPPLPPRDRRGLVIALFEFEPPSAGGVSAVVAIRDGAAPATVVGRFSPYPATAFKARSEDEAQRFQFDVTTVVPTSGGGSWSAEIRLESLHQDQPIPGARMRFGWARLFPLR